MAVSAAHLTNGTAEAVPVSTASVSPGSNRLLLLAVVVRLTGTAPSDSLTVTGLGLTWVKVGTVVYTNRRRAWVYRALGTPSAGTVTINSGDAAVITNVLWSLDEFAGVNTSGADGSGAVADVATNAVSATTTISVTIAGAGVDGDATYGAGAFETTGPVTTEAGWVDLVVQTDDDNIRRQSVSWDIDRDTTPSWSWTNNNFAAGAIGLRIVGAGGAAAPGRVPGLVVAYPTFF